MVESLPFLEKCAKDASADTCIVCGETNNFCLDKHHPYTKAVDPDTTVSLCASCHRIYDRGQGLNMLKERRGRLLEVNRDYRP